MSPIVTPPKASETLMDVNPDAAGLDIGHDEIWACVPTERATPAVRVFGTYTPDLNALADWLVLCGIQTAALESTGVYWIPIYEILEARASKSTSSTRAI